MMSDLEVLFTSTARVEVLRLFLLNPDRRFYQREIERETGQPIRAVQREVTRLNEIDLLGRSKEGNRVFYHLNPDFPLQSELTALFRKASGVKQAGRRAGGEPVIVVDPSSTEEAFPWLESECIAPLPVALRRVQIDGEWDRAY
ncbi:hypothetical protein ACFLWA_07745 [Chloroflexota bacterium]